MHHYMSHIAQHWRFRHKIYKCVSNLNEAKYKKNKGAEGFLS